MFNEKDLEQLEQHGLTLEEVEKQIKQFEEGYEHIQIERAATIDDGILRIDAKEKKSAIERYEKAVKSKKIVKFVPASGAATRMFKDLFEYVACPKEESPMVGLAKDYKKFAFADELKIAGTTPKQIIESIIEYGAKLPKALILFHTYGKEHRTAMDEHLVEGAQYANSNGRVHIHFTISEEHREGFETQLEKVKAGYEEKYGVKYDISFSVQNHSTDTLAVTLDNKPFRKEDGSLLFRPAGHGALIENLNQIDADIVFIKNIDNVTTDRLKPDTEKCSKMFGGILLALQEEVATMIEKLDKSVNKESLKECAEFIYKQLHYKLPKTYDLLSDEELAHKYHSILNRPIRLCGMVKNEGEPGGGPFWVKNTDCSSALQIVEMAQIAPHRQHLLKEGTHFNPVYLVCGTKNYKGKKFDLPKYIDKNSGFISNKSRNGRPLKALELPGLWNGSMAYWHTIFIEIPLSAFTPVKEVKDLLRAEHQ